MRDFFGQQQRARRSTRLLLVWYGLAVIGVVISVYLVLRWTVVLVDGGIPYPMWQDPVLAWTAVVVLLLIFTSTVVKSLQLGKGGPAIAEMLGGRRVVHSGADFKERRLVNVVEEMAIASGVPMPAVYVLDKEPGINAFAAGLTTENAVVAVTSGALSYLNREQLQGVIGHEFSHILNGDMRLNVRLVGILAGIATIATIGWIVVRNAPRALDSKKGAGAAAVAVLLGVGLMIVGSLGALFARIIQAAISRRRECLADASAVQFTRNPGGLAQALLRIRSFSAGSKLKDGHASELAHFFFAGGTKFSLSGLLATHPSLETRIEALVPGMHLEPIAVQPIGDTDEDVEPGLRDDLGLTRGLTPSRVTPDELVARVGTVSQGQLWFGGELLRSLPESIRIAVHDPFSARSVICALLLDAREEVATKQVFAISLALGGVVAREAREMSAAIAECDPRLRLSLVDLSLPALAQMSPSQTQAFAALVDQLVAADGDVSTFELALQKTLMRRLAKRSPATASPTIKHGSMRTLGAPAALILGTLARAAAKDEGEAEAAFARGKERLAQDVAVILPPAESCNRAALDAALAEFEMAAQAPKKRILLACADVAAADGRLSTSEVELVRAIADTLDCPLPL